MEVSISHDDGLMKAETKKFRKYLDLAHYITDIWDVNSTERIPLFYCVLQK